MLSLDLSSGKAKREISMPSISILPRDGSMARNRLRARVLFPEPVAPTKPTRMPGCQSVTLGLRSWDAHLDVKGYPVQNFGKIVGVPHGQALDRDTALTGPVL
jgi:hypothetical protein